MAVTQEPIGPAQEPRGRTQEPGERAPEPGGAQEPGGAAPEPGDAAPEPGGVASEPGRAAQEAGGPAPGLNPLQRLIRQRLETQGWSYGDVAKRGGLPRSTVYTLATTRNLARPPRPATLNGLAWGLDLPVSMIRSAAAESTGLHYYDDEPGSAGPAGPEAATSGSADSGSPGDPERDVLIASIDELTAEDRQHVAALVESLRKKADADQTDR